MTLKKIFLNLLLCCLLLASLTVQNELDETPDECSLTDAAKARLTSDCFSELQNVIACMSPTEQDAWANANELNTDPTLCFNCDNMKISLKEGFKKKVSSLAAKLTTKARGKRKGMSCLKKFSFRLDSTSKEEIEDSLESMVAYQKQGSQCQATLVQTVENIMITKRKLFCVPTADIETMSITDVDGTVSDIKYTIADAKSIVDAFLTFFDCQASSSAMIVNEIASVGDVIATSSTCAVEATTDESDSSRAKIRKGKALGTDVLTYITAVSNLSTTFPVDEFTTFITNLTNSFNGVNPINCNPGGFQSFISNIDTSGDSATFVELFNQAKEKCENAYTLFVTDGNVTCAGTCNLTGLNLTFLDSAKVPKNYNVVAGCTASESFTYVTYTDLVDSTKVYTSFSFEGSSDKYKSDVRCLAKARGCMPGGLQSGGDARDGTCPSLKDSCKSELNGDCSKSGLLTVITTGNSSSPYPSDCDAMAMGTDTTSDEFVMKCFDYIYSNFVRKGMNLNPLSIVNSDKSLAEDTNTDIEDARFRNLQTTLVVTSDAITYPVTFTDVQLSSSDVIVDPGTISDGMSQITSDANSSHIAKFAYGLLFVVFALLI